MTKKFELFFERLKKAADSTSDKELGEWLGINKSTLSMWKKREKVDFELLFKKFEHVNYHWLLTGEGKMDRKKNTESASDQSYIIELQAELIHKLKTEIKELKKAQEPRSTYRNVAEPDD